jgi:hypothetical protein
MGTSVSQPSPATRNWEAAQSTYKSDIFPADRVLQEIWRAATNQDEGNIATQLAAPIVNRLREIVQQGGKPIEVASAINREIALSRQNSLGVEIARRAALQSLSTENRNQAFSERLFAEASNYLVSRDLSGFIGSEFRNKMVSDSLRFKQSVADAAVQSVNSVTASQGTTETQWREYIAAVIQQFKERKR